MNRRVITVLYEDQSATAKPNNFGPHLLVLACVGDAIEADRWELRNTIKAIPKKGDSKLRAALKDEGALISNAGPLCAVFDNDEVRRCYGLPNAACKRDVKAAIAAEAGGAPGIVLLEENVEDVVAACCNAANAPIPHSKPTLAERDRICNRAATADASLRRRILDQTPSFERLVKMLVRLIDELNANAAIADVMET